MRVVVLDRDGVINADRADSVTSIADFQPLPGSLEAIGALCRAGYRVVVASNQAAVARGRVASATLDAIHAHLNGLLAAHEARIDAFFVCPHAPEDGCACRKPKPGLLHAVAARYGVALLETPFVGDSARDLDAARAAGAQPVLVRTGKGAGTEASYPHLADVRVYADLAAFATALLGSR